MEHNRAASLKVILNTESESTFPQGEAQSNSGEMDIYPTCAVTEL